MLLAFARLEPGRTGRRAEQPSVARSSAAVARRRFVGGAGRRQSGRGGWRDRRCHDRKPRLRRRARRGGAATAIYQNGLLCAAARPAGWVGVFAALIAKDGRRIRTPRAVLRSCPGLHTQPAPTIRAAAPSVGPGRLPLPLPRKVAPTVSGSFGQDFAFSRRAPTYLPPSTGSSTPVMKLASSEAKKQRGG